MGLMAQAIRPVLKVVLSLYEGYFAPGTSYVQNSSGV